MAEPMLSSKKRKRPTHPPLVGIFTRSKSQIYLHRNRSGCSRSDYSQSQSLSKKPRRRDTILHSSILVKDLRTRRIFSDGCGLGGLNEEEENTCEKRFGISENRFSEEVKSDEDGGVSDEVTTPPDIDLFIAKGQAEENGIPEIKDPFSEKQWNGGYQKGKSNGTNAGIKPLLCPRPRMKLFKAPGSFSYRRLLPYLMDVSKDYSCAPKLDQSPRIDKGLEEKPVLTYHGQEILINKYKVERNNDEYVNEANSASIECIKESSISVDSQNQLNMSEDFSLSSISMVEDWPQPVVNDSKPKDSVSASSQNLNNSNCSLSLIIKKCDHKETGVDQSSEGTILSKTGEEYTSDVREYSKVNDVCHVNSNMSGKKPNESLSNSDQRGGDHGEVQSNQEYVLMTPQDADQSSEGTILSKTGEAYTSHVNSNMSGKKPNESLSNSEQRGGDHGEVQSNREYVLMTPPDADQSSEGMILSKTGEAYTSDVREYSKVNDVCHVNSNMSSKKPNESLSNSEQRGGDHGEVQSNQEYVLMTPPDADQSSEGTILSKTGEAYTSDIREYSKVNDVCHVNSNMSGKKPNESLSNSEQRGGDHGEVQSNQEYVLMTPPDADIFGKPEVAENGGNSVKSTLGTADQVFWKPVDLSINRNNSRLEDKSIDSSPRRKWALSRCSQLKLFKVPGSTSYRRMLPFLIDVTKDNSCFLGKNHHLKPEKCLEEKPTLPSSVSDSQEMLNENSEVDGCHTERDINISDCCSPPITISTASLNDQESNPSYDHVNETPKPCNSQQEREVHFEQEMSDTERKLGTGPQMMDINCGSNPPASPLPSLLGSGSLSREDAKFVSNEVHTGEECTQLVIKVTNGEKQIETNSLHRDSSYLEATLQLDIPPTALKKGILKRTPQGCRGLCTCLNCSSFRLNAEKAFEFSSNQMQDAEDVAIDLIKELSYMRNMLEKSALGADGSAVVCINQVKEACKRASEAEELARKSLNQMNFDLKAHCRVTRAQRPRVRFANRVEEQVITYSDLPSK